MYFVADHTDAGLTSYTKLLAEKYLGFKSSDVEDIECGYACSDHASWNRQGVAAVFPFEATFQNYNKQIHTSADTLSLVDMSHAFKYVRLAGIFVADLAEVVQ
jgi:leucyl aminopeptidase